jgi:hypothetical protein
VPGETFLTLLPSRPETQSALPKNPFTIKKVNKSAKRCLAPLQLYQIHKGVPGTFIRLLPPGEGVIAVDARIRVGGPTNDQLVRNAG